MHLTPSEEDRLLVFTVAELARRSLSRGLKLNAPESIALVCDEMHEAARGGATYEEVVEAARRAISPNQLMDAVPELVPEIRVEVLLDEGTRLVVLRNPWGGPGESTEAAEADIELAPGRDRVVVSVTNSSARPVRVSSHYPFWRVNPHLSFDRVAARGFRLDVSAGSSVRWAPGETREVALVRYGGESA